MTGQPCSDHIHVSCVPSTRRQGFLLNHRPLSAAREWTPLKVLTVITPGQGSRNTAGLLRYLYHATTPMLDSPRTARSCLLLFASMPAMLSAQQLINTCWELQGGAEAIKDMAVDSANNVLYVGGYFSGLRPSAAYGIVVDTITGAMDTRFAKPDQAFLCAAPDGQGGWFLGGDFEHIGTEPRRSIAHVDSTGRLSDLDPDITGYVADMALDGNLLYVVGGVIAVGGVPRSSMAAIDITTGQPTSWAPSTPIPFDQVATIAVGDGVIYIGGTFTEVNGQPHANIAAIDSATGAVLAWEPYCDAEVHDLLYQDGVLYVGGVFTSIGGQIRHGIAALEATTGNALNLNPAGLSTVDVRTMALSADRIFFGGEFTDLNGTPRQHLAAADLATGLLDAWDPDWQSYPDEVNSVCVSGGSVYASSSWFSFQENYLEAFNITSGASRPWSPPVSARVSDLVSDGTRMYVIGNFDHVDVIVGRASLAALDLATGAPTSWAVPVSGGVNALSLSDGVLYVGGEFTQLGAVPTSNLGAVDVATQTAQAGWTPNPNGPVQDVLVDGPRVYAAGEFTYIGGVLRAGLAALDRSTGLSIVPWNPAPSGPVTRLGKHGGMIYAGGAFMDIGGQSRNNLAELNTTNGAATAFDAQFFGGLEDMDVSDAGLLMTGWQLSANGSVDFTVALLIDFDGTLAAWSPGFDSGQGYAITTDGTSVFVAGDHSTIGGEPCAQLSSISLSSGQANRCFPVPMTDVSHIAVHDSLMYIGGRFENVGPERRNMLAAFKLGPVDFNTGIAAASPARATERVWPNPAADRIHFTERVTGSVLDAQGRTVLNVTNAMDIDVSRLLPGLYVLHAEGKDVIRFVVE